MPDLNFEIKGAQAIPYAAAPTLAFKLQITSAEPALSVHSIALRCQIQIEAARRRYGAKEQERLLDLYGEPERWSQTLRTMLWTHVSAVVPPFIGAATIDLPVACTFDFNVASAKYFAGLEDGEVPLCFLFSGTIFYEDQAGALQVSQISWEKEAYYKLPVHIWQEMMEHYYPKSAWLCLRRDVFDRLSSYKMRRGIPTWEQALESILLAAEEQQKLEESVPS